MSADYSVYGLNQYLQGTSSITAQGSIVTAVEFDVKYEVSSDKLNASKVNLGNFIKRQAGGSAMGTFTSSQAFDVTSSITYKTPKGANPTFGKPIVGLYQGAGTLGSNQIYPIRGGSVTLGRYDVVGGQMDYSHYNGTADEWRGMLIDTNGTSNQVFTFIADWIFADYVSGNQV